MLHSRPSRCPSHLVIHLVKLVNQADTLVCQHQGTTLQRPLLSDWVLVHTGCQTDSTGTLACMATNRKMAYDLFAERLPSRQEGPHSAAATAQTAAQHCRLYTNDLLSLLSIFEHCCEAVPALTSAASPIKTIIVLGWDCQTDPMLLLAHVPHPYLSCTLRAPLFSPRT